MKIVVFGPDKRVGAIVDNHVVDLAGAYDRQFGVGVGGGIPTGLEQFIASGNAGLDKARELLARVDVSDPVVSAPLRDAEVAAPVIHRPRVACAGGNYALHYARAMSAGSGSMSRVMSADVAKAEARASAQADDYMGFWKLPAVIAGPGDQVVRPARAGDYFDYEGEIAVVIGKPAVDVRAKDAANHFWGLTLLNDWSIRGKRLEPRTLCFNMAKNFDTCLSIGPCIVVGEGLDPQNLRIQTRVNGEIRQDYHTGEMTFSLAEYLEFLSKDFTFMPGDVLCAGTGTGTAMDSSPRGADGKVPTALFLKPGDAVSVSCPAIGELTNTVIAKV